MTVAELVDALAAEGIQVHPDYIRNIELGHKDPSDKVIGGIARALKISKLAILRGHLDEVA